MQACKNVLNMLLTSCYDSIKVFPTISLIGFWMTGTAMASRMESDANHVRCPWLLLLRDNLKNGAMFVYILAL